MHIKPTLFTPLVSALLLAGSAGLQAAIITFTPMDNISVSAPAPNATRDSRTMSVSDFGQVMAIDAQENVFVWSEEGYHKLGNHDCDNGHTSEPTNLMNLSGNGEQAVWRCRDNGRPNISKRTDTSYTTSVLRIGGQTITGPDLDLHIAAKDGNAFKLAPHRTSYPKAGQPRIALQLGATTSYVEQYFTATQLDHGQVMTFSPNGQYVMVNAGADRYLVNLANQSVQPVDAGFGFVHFISNDGQSILGTTGVCYWVCGTSVQRWDAKDGLSTIASSNGVVWYGAQDSSADASKAIYYEYSFGENLSTRFTPYIWTEEDGSQLFESYLEQNGAYLQGWSELTPLTFSQNGRFIAGVGTNAEGESGKGFLIEVQPDDQCVVPY